jgi:hypothetical protein
MDGLKRSLDLNLTKAVSAGNLAFVQRFCNAGANPADVSTQNFHNGVALTVAVEKGHKDVARYLVAHERMNRMALSIAVGDAAAKGFLDLVEVFCDQGGDLRFGEDFAIRKAWPVRSGRFFLMFGLFLSTFFLSLAIAEFCLLHGTDPRSKNDYAIFFGSPERAFGYMQMVAETGGAC